MATELRLLGLMVNSHRFTWWKWEWSHTL